MIIDNKYLEHMPNRRPLTNFKRGGSIALKSHCILAFNRLSYNVPCILEAAKRFGDQGLKRGRGCAGIGFREGRLASLGVSFGAYIQRVP